MSRSTLPVFLHMVFLSGSVITPCPAELRELSTDRPDTTESPYSVDKGRWQLEMEIAAWRLDGGELESRSLAETNVKFGLSAASDLQLVLPGYTDDLGGEEGIGDIQIRLKYNLWGNDGGPHAMALMPYLKLPTASGGLGNGHVEGGLILPFAFQAPAGWSIGCMGQFDLVSDDDGGGVIGEGLFSVAAGHDLTASTAIFFEFACLVSPEGGDERETYFNAGCTWMRGEMMQWDAGFRVGLDSGSEELVPFAGVSRKF